MSGGDEPCKCHKSFAYITPTHPGHCCFLSRFATCHPDEVAAWERRRDGLDPLPAGVGPADPETKEPTRG